MLTTVLNDSPIFPENEEEQADLSAPLLMDSPQVKLWSSRLPYDRQRNFNSPAEEMSVLWGVKTLILFLNLSNSRISTIQYWTHLKDFVT